MRLVPIECTREGCYLARTIFDENGRALLKEGVKLTSNLIQRIKDIHIYSLYVVDEYSENEIEDIIKPELRQKSIKLVKDTFCNVENQHFNNNSLLNSNKKKNICKKKEQYLSSIYELAEELLENILSNKNIMVNLVDIKSMDNYTYQHSTNVAILSLVLGIGIGLPKRDLMDLCIGALLHDIGKVFIDKKLIQKKGALTIDEYEEVKKHSECGYKYLKNVHSLSVNVRMIVLQHHERYDGGGYPKGKYGEKINKLAKIVAVADVYDALISDRHYKRAVPPNEAFEYILGNAGSMFEYNIVKAFSTIILPYPQGVLVKLSNGDVGIVEDLVPNYPLRPYIKILKSDDNSKVGKFVNLVTELSLVISGVQYEQF